MNRSRHTITCKNGISFVLLIFILLPGLAGADDFLILDCRVSQANPALDLLDMPELGLILLSEHYRFLIIPGLSDGFATTLRAANLLSKVKETHNYFEIYFENKSITIDRFTGTFQLSIPGAKASLGSGSCVQIRERQF
jgi:hypothetical protein